jgi:hypothetical protein
VKCHKCTPFNTCIFSQRNWKTTGRYMASLPTLNAGKLPLNIILLHCLQVIAHCAFLQKITNAHHLTNICNLLQGIR